MHGNPILRKTPTMTVAGTAYTCALLVAAIFVIAAVAKLRAPALTEEAFTRQGLPTPGVLARVIPIAELVIATGLVLVPVIGAVFALVLLSFFTTFLVSRVRAGTDAPCNCYGPHDQEPISMANVAGNAFLMLAALVALWSEGPIRPSPLDLVAAGTLLAADLAVQALIRKRHRKDEPAAERTST